MHSNIAVRDGRTFPDQPPPNSVIARRAHRDGLIELYLSSASTVASVPMITGVRDYTLQAAARAIAFSKLMGDVEGILRALAVVAQVLTAMNGLQSVVILLGECFGRIVSCSRLGASFLSYDPIPPP